MKRFALLMAIAITAIACKKEEAVIPKLELKDPDVALTIPAEGGFATINFNVNVDWTAKLKETAIEWCTVSPASGKSGTTSVKVYAEENTTDDNRNAIVILKADKFEKEITVTQLQKNTIQLEGQNQYEIPMNGGEIKLSINHNIPYTIETPSWILVSETKAMTKDEISLTVKAQEEDGAERLGNVIIKNNVKDIEISVKQAAWEPNFELKDQICEIPQSGGEAKFTVCANIEYKVETSDGNWGVLEQKGNTYTFKANEANNAFGERTAKINILPVKEKYKDKAVTLIVIQEGKAKLKWSCHPTGDIKNFESGNISRLSILGETLIVSNYNKVHTLSPSNGKQLATINLPEGIHADNIITDEKGNILVSSNAATASQMDIYKVTDVKTFEAQKFIEYNTGSYYCVSTGNIRVNGDINGEAVVAAAVATGSDGAVIVWEVKNGIAQDMIWTKAPYSGWSSENLCATPAGKKLEDGLYYLGYGGDYCPYFLPSITPQANGWKKLHNATGDSNCNFNCISTTEFKGKKYIAYTQGAHFNYSSPALVILDATDPDSAEVVMKYSFDNLVKRDENWANTNWTGTGAFSDVLLTTTGNTMHAYFIDTNFNVLGCIEIQ